MKLTDLTAGYVEKVDASTLLGEAARRMVSKGVGSLVVVGQGRVRGIFTEHDLTRAAAHGADLAEGVVDDWMSEHPHLATPDWTVDQAADRMVEHGIRHLPLIDASGKAAGMVSIKDVLWALRGPSIPSVD